MACRRTRSPRWPKHQTAISGWARSVDWRASMGWISEVLDPSNTPNMPGAGIVNLHLDKSGRLWVSTLEGLGVRDGGTWRKFGPEDGWPGDSARTISERANGDLLVTTFNGKIVEFSGGRFTSLPSPGEPDYGYFGHVDENGQWWAVQNRFIGRWDGKQWVSMMTPPGVQRSEVGCGRANDGGMWLLLGSELRKIRDGKEVSRIVLPDRPSSVWSLAEDRRGNVWITSDGNGLYQVTPAGPSRKWTQESGLASRSVRFAFEDREHCLWVGTNSGGLQRFRRRMLPERRSGGDRGVADRPLCGRRSRWPHLARNVWPRRAGRRECFGWVEDRAPG